jgi:tetratricopeptide (TPR) repeat protein
MSDRRKEILAMIHHRPGELFLRRSLRLLGIIGCLVCSVQPAPAASQPSAFDTRSQASDRVTTLLRQAKVLASENNFAAAGAMLSELIALDETKTLPNNRGIGRAFVEIATVLSPSRDYDRLEHIFVRGIQILENSTETVLGDIVVGLNNLGVLYDQKGDSRARERVNSSIINFAVDYDGPLDSDSVKVFLSLGDIYARAGHPKAVAILYRQIHRYMQQADFAEDTRYVVLHRYAHALAGDHQYDKAIEVWAQAFNLKDDRSPISVKILVEGLTVRHGLHELPDVLSDTATVYFKAGRLEQASGIYWHALVRRAQVAGAGIERGSTRLPQ